MAYAYRDRKDRKGAFRRLWIQRINAAARADGMTYNRFIQGLKLAGVDVDRRMLAELAVTDRPRSPRWSRWPEGAARRTSTTESADTEAASGQRARNGGAR